MHTQTTVRLVVGILGLVAVIVLIGGIALALDDKSLPGELIAIGSLAVGAVAGILSNTKDAGSVYVTNPPSDPVPVDSSGGDRGHSSEMTAVVVVLLIIAIALLVL